MRYIFRIWRTSTSIPSITRAGMMNLVHRLVSMNRIKCPFHSVKWYYFACQPLGWGLYVAVGPELKFWMLSGKNTSSKCFICSSSLSVYFKICKRRLPSCWLRLLTRIRFDLEVASSGLVFSYPWCSFSWPYGQKLLMKNWDNWLLIRVVGKWEHSKNFKYNLGHIL